MLDHKIKAGNYIKIEIEDSGIGMSDELKGHIFEPFFTTKGLGKGTGLGLSVTYNAIHENNGFINVHSEVDKGTVIKVYLPIDEDEDQDQDQDQITGGTRLHEQLVLGSGSILLVEDESVVRIIAGEMLQQLGYEVIFAVDGEEGLAMYKDKQEEIDLVILDVVMPKKNGKDVFYELQEINPSVTVLMSSGFAQDTSITGLINDGATGFIQKPFLLAELSKKIAQVMHT